MPTFMDRHNRVDATPDEMAGAHRLDLEVQQRYDVRFLAYWFDPDRELAFCLAEAPDAEAMERVHAASHGAVAAEIVEVDLDEVTAFLGRTSEPAPDDPAMEDFRPGAAFRTIVFTDMVASTPLTMHLGDIRAMKVLEDHNQAISAAVALHGGRVVKHTGDGFMISFDEVEDAVRAAVRIQRDVSSLHELLAIKIGINPGNPVERGDDLFGMTVQLAARVCDQAEPGQILVSGIVRELCADPTLTPCFVDHGRVALSGFDSALQVYDVHWRDI